jgi:hypothetical protein
MPLVAAALPLATPPDASADPPGSIDPLGTLSHAERLADLLLPGFTARMWRARLLTVATVTAAVADRALRHLGRREDARLDARLSFERLAVSAVVRLALKYPDTYGSARRGLPGSDLARAALAGEDEPLTRHNFLKGQAVNGPYGVMARLALHLGLVDEDGRLGRYGPALLLAWAEDQRLPGVLDDEGRASRPGALWIEEAARQTARCINEGDWPARGSVFWQRLTDALRPDQPGPSEIRVLVGLLDADSVRARVLALLRQGVDFYRRYDPEGRGKVEREVLTRAVRPRLGDGPVDGLIDAVGFVAHVYEAASHWLQQGFDAILWGLKQLGGSATPDALLGHAAVRGSLERARTALRSGLRALDTALTRLQDSPTLARPELTGPLGHLRDDIIAGLDSPASFRDALVCRHERVQREKRKGAWIDRDARWTLLPGFGIGGDQPPDHGPAFLHPFRIRNAYALLAGLGEVSLEAPDGEE